MTDPQYKAMTRFLRDLGTESVPHTGTAFLSHLVGVYNDLRAWDATTEVCRAGMFHSIYGTEMFQKFALPLEQRDEVRELIGEHAEFVAWVNCVMDRSTFDEQLETSPPFSIRNRLTGEWIEMDQEQFTDLCIVHLCDWLEQLPRLKKWDLHRHRYRFIAENLGGIALESFDRVYADEPTAPAASV